MNNRQYSVYLMTNRNGSVIYTGVTNDLKKRVYEHKQKLAGGFTSKYNINQLAHYEIYDHPLEAIEREKQIKAGSRGKKVELIQRMNPERKDLYENL